MLQSVSKIIYSLCVESQCFAHLPTICLFVYETCKCTQCLYSLSDIKGLYHAKTTVLEAML